MRRSRRKMPAGGLFRGRELPRLFTMLAMLAVLWMMAARARDPDTWRWLTSDPEGGKKTERDPEIADHAPPPAKALRPAAAESADVAVPGPTDEDPEELDAAREEFQAVSDREPLAVEEMPAYWRLMKWARAQSFDQLKKRAAAEARGQPGGHIFFTQVWEQPEKYRGKLLYLRLHLKRALAHEAPENALGVKQVYEAWGWTEESKSFPYLVVFPDRPAGLPLGPDIHEEAVFVGYFLKLMSYEAFDVRRAAPLVIGRLHWKENLARTALRQNRPGYFWPVALGGGVLLLVLVLRWVYLFRRPRKRQRSVETASSPRDEAMVRWLEGAGEAPDFNEPDGASADPNRPSDSWLEP